VNGVDREGYSTDSIHLDKNGREIANYDDGDDSVYQHDDIDLNEQHIDGARASLGTSFALDGSTARGGRKVLGLGNSEGEEGRITPGAIPEYYWHSGSNVHESGWMSYSEYNQMYYEEAVTTHQLLSLEEGTVRNDVDISSIDLSTIVTLDVKGEEANAEVFRRKAFVMAAGDRRVSEWNTSQKYPGTINPFYPELYFFPLPKVGSISTIVNRGVAQTGKSSLGLASKATGIQIKKNSGITITKQLANAEKAQWKISLMTKTSFTEGRAVFHYKNFKSKYEFGIHYHNLPTIGKHYKGLGYKGIDQKFWHYHRGVGKANKKHYQLFKNKSILSDQKIMHSGDFEHLRTSIFGLY
jgi:hypothetical protein